MTGRNNLGEDAEGSVVVTVADVVRGVELITGPALVTGRLKHTVRIKEQILRFADQSISYKSVLGILVHYDLYIVARLQILVVETLSHRHFG